MNRIHTWTLASTPDYKITLHEGMTRREKLVITFGVIDSGLSEKGFGTDFLLESGWDTIYVAQRALSQYQGLDVEAFYKAVSPFIGRRQVYTYGMSLGGYCALYFGGVVDARIIAMSPLNSAHPSIRKPELSRVVWTHRELSDVPRSSHRPVIVFDPHKEKDKAFVTRWALPAYSDPLLVQQPFVGHRIGKAMKDAGQLKHFIVSIIDHDMVPEVTLFEEGGRVWHCKRGLHFLANGDLQAAETEFRRSLKLGLEKGAVNGLMRLLLRQKRQNDIRILLSEIGEKQTSELPDEIKMRIRRVLGHEVIGLGSDSG